MNPGDWGRIAELVRAQGVDPANLPDCGRNVICRRVVEEGGLVIAAAVTRLEVMAHLYLDPKWETPAFRLAAFQLLHAEMRRELKEKGIQHAHAELAPGIERAFGRRLRALGWDPARWKNYVLEI